jgi:hypothetical protein
MICEVAILQGMRGNEKPDRKRDIRCIAVYMRRDLRAMHSFAKTRRADSGNSGSASNHGYSVRKVPQHLL